MIKTYKKTFLVEMTRRPISLDQSPSSGIVLIYAFSGIVLFLIGLFSGVSLLTLVGIGLLIRALFLHNQVHHVTLHDDHVDIKTETLFRALSSMTIPLADYQGLQIGKKLIRYGKHDYRIHQTITLVHVKNGLNICLYEQREDNVPRLQWQRYAQWLNVPILAEDGTEFKKIAPDEIGLTLQQRHNNKNTPTVKDENKVLPALKRPKLKNETRSCDLPKISNMPRSLEVIQPQTPYQETLKIQINSDRVKLLTKLLLLTFSLGSILHPFYTEKTYPLMIFLGIITVLWFILVTVVDLSDFRVLTLNNREIKLHDIWTFANTKRTVKKIDFDKIETILIQGSGQFAQTLVISSREGEIKLGQGLDMATLKWLQSYLRAAVVTA